MIHLITTALFICVMIFSDTYAQTPVEKRTNALISQINSKQPDEKHLVWIFFENKGNQTEQYFINPLNVVSKKSLQRRTKMFTEGNLLSYRDIPVNPAYINYVEELGLTIRHKTKWFNGVSGFANASAITQIMYLPFVKQIDLVARLRKHYPEIIDGTIENQSQPVVIYKQGEVNNYNYGNSFTQLNQINVPSVHNLGYTGQGITICVMDAGFNRLTHEVFADMNIVATWDFVNNREYVGDGQGGQGSGTHGTQTLSVIGGFKEGKLIGPAFNANFLLAKTENTESETPIEEDNWIAALEWADSIGVDVTSTSLGYLTFDPPYPSYTWMDMDGNTARITVAADLATHIGIVVVNSAGNGGFHSTRNTLSAPADGDSVISIGAVTSSGNRSSFSSVGPTVDGRIKPDVAAMGSSVYVASASGNTNYTNSSGTSFSCPLAAGVAALILDANYTLTPMQVRDALRNTASQNSNPDRLLGWGIIDALLAVNYFPIPVELVSFSGNAVQGGVMLKWTTATEQNNLGFEIQRRTQDSEFYPIGFVQGNGTTTTPSNYSFTDNTAISGLNFYRLKQVDFDGSSSYSNEIGVDSDFIISHKLFQNYPNPFNPATVIRFSIAGRSFISLKIFDALGNEVSTLIFGYKDSGEHEINFNAESLSTGVYFAELRVDNFRQVIKMILAK